MSKTILITGSTDGIGKLTARQLAAQGHEVLLHGRNEAKLAAAASEIEGDTERYVADLSRLSEVENLANAVLSRHARLDVLINNAGVLRTNAPTAPGQLDQRFVVNTLAPYLLTRLLLHAVPQTGRIVNLSSAAQAPVDMDAMAGRVALDDMQAYAQSKLALTIWSMKLAQELPEGPAVIAVNPGSLLASKMVKEGFGVDGKDLGIGARVLCRAALDESFADASGKYFDNDVQRFSPPHAAALDPQHTRSVLQSIEQLVAPFAVQTGPSSGT